MKYVCVKGGSILLLLAITFSADLSSAAQEKHVRGSSPHDRNKNHGPRTEQWNTQSSEQGNGEQEVTRKYRFNQVKAAPRNGTVNVGQKNKIGRQIKGIESVDKKGNKHQRYQVDVNGIPVFGYQEIVHQDQGNGRTRTTKNPTMYDSMYDVDTNPSITQDDAASTALNYIGGNSKILSNELNIFVKGNKGYLVYKVLIAKLDDQGLAILGQPLVFVDAHMNKILHEVETLVVVEESILSNEIAAKGTGGGGNGRGVGAPLLDATKVVYNPNYETGELEQVGRSGDLVLLNIFNHVQTLLDFLKTKANLDSYDGLGVKITAFGHYYFDNYFCFCYGSDFNFGDGDGITYGPWGVLDIVSYAFGSAVDYYSSALFLGTDEAKSLYITNSDIFVAAVKAFANKGEINENTWKFPIGLTLDGSTFKDMRAPSINFRNNGNARDHYSNKFVSDNSDLAGKYNSPIGSHWFYLLVNGGQHHNPMYRTGTIINGIGMDKAFDIWIHALINYMEPSSKFNDARIETMIACIELGYDPETICASVQNAWAEVGVETVYVPPNGCSTADEISVQLYLTTDLYAEYDNVLHLGKVNGEIIWDVNTFSPATQYEPFKACLDPKQCYALTFLDLYGDGLKSPGSLILMVDGKVEANNIDLGYGFFQKFGDCPSEAKYADFKIAIKTDGDPNSENVLLTLENLVTNEKIWERFSFEPYETTLLEATLDMSICYGMGIYDLNGNGIEYEDAITLFLDNEIVFRGPLAPGTAFVGTIGDGCP